MNSNKNSALIFNCNNIMSLPIIRSLGQCGVEITACFGFGKYPSRFQDIIKCSKYIKKSIFFDEANYENSLIEALMTHGKSQNFKPVLFISSDQDLEIISRNRQQISDYYHFSLPEHDLIDKLLCKEKFIDLAINYKLPIPKSKKINDINNILSAVNNFNYPFIIKPSWRNNDWLFKFKSEKTFYIKTREDLLYLASRLKNIKTNFLIQEIIPGPESNIFCVFAVLDKHSEPIEIGTCRKIRQYPKDFGNTSIAELISNKEIEELSRKIFKKLKLIGYASIEFKFDPSVEDFKIIEITPNRFNRQFMVTNIIGLNLPFSLYKMEIGLENNIPDFKIKERFWISEVNEIRTFKDYLKSNEFSFLEYLKLILKVRKFEIFDFRDIKPFILLIINYVKKNILFA